MSRKIFITGCAKTGTTLVRRLFNAFDLTVFNGGEISLNSFINSEYEVGKRMYGTVFSNVLSDKQIADQLKAIEDNNVEIVNVVRDKQDTLNSTNGYVKEERYDSCVNQSDRYKDYIDYTINYSDLISSPDEVQKSLAETLKLTVVHKWSDFPDWFDNSEEPKTGIFSSKEYSLRGVGDPKQIVLNKNARLTLPRMR